MKCAKDYLDLFDGGSITSTRIGRFCGDVYPTVIESTTNYMTVLFRSDSNTVRTGFELSYVWKNGECWSSSILITSLYMMDSSFFIIRVSPITLLRLVILLTTGFALLSSCDN